MPDVIVERWLKHPPERVWRALSTPSLARRWLPFQDYRPIVGHRFVARGPAGDAPCEVLVVEAPYRVDILWQQDHVDTRLQITLAAQAGGTQLRLEHRDLPQRCYSPFLTAWSGHLVSLQSALAPLSTYATVGLGLILATVSIVGLGWLSLGGSTTEPTEPEAVRTEARSEARSEGPTPVQRPPSDPVVEPATPAVPRPALPAIPWDGEKITVLEHALPTTLHPLYPQTEVDRRVHALLFDRLFHRSTVTSELKSRVIAATDRSGDTLRLTLRDDLRFHDGQPLTSEDVCFSIEAALDPASTVSIADRGVLGCTAVDATHATIRFDAAVAEPRARIAVPVLPAHAFSASPHPQDSFATAPIGSGPYQARLGRRRVRLVPAPSPHHPVELGAIVLEAGGDPGVQVRMLEAGLTHGIVHVEPQHLGPVRASDDLSVKTFDPRSALYLAVAPRVPMQLRRALDAAIDRRALHDAVYGPNHVLSGAPISSGPWLPSSPHYDRRVRPTEPSPERVTATMNRWGAVREGGVWTREHAPVVLRFGAAALDRPHPRVLLELLPRMLREAGFRVERVERPEDADLWLVRHHWGTFEEADALLAGGPYPRASEEIRGLLERMKTAPTETERMDAGHALHAQMAAEKRVLPLWPEVLKSAWSNQIRSNTISPSTFWDEVDSWRP